MKIKIDNHELTLNEEYIGYLFVTNIVSNKYKMQYLEINGNTLIYFNSCQIKFNEFKKINRKIINHLASNITQCSYKYNNIIISTRYNYDNHEEITFILIENENIYKSLAVPINHIVDNIYIGNLLSAIDDDYLFENNIKNIIRVYDGELEQKQHINYFIIDIDDNLSIDITKYFEEFINFIKNSNGNILVHCQHGSSRSGSFVILYLMYFHKMDFVQALNFARTKRYGICPNENFKNQLMNFQFLK